MATFNAGSIEATLDLDVDPFHRGIIEARAEGRRFGSETFRAKVDVDSAGAMGQMRLMRAEIDRVARSHAIGFEVVGMAAAMLGIQRLSRQIDRLAGEPHNIDIDVDAAGAAAHIAALEAQLDALSRDRNVNIDADASGFASSVGGASSRLGSLIALGALIGPALIPGLVGATAAAGGLLSALSAAGGAAGFLGAGVIGNIMQVTGAQDDLEKSTTAVQSATLAATAAQQGAAQAAQQVKNAEQALADARRVGAQQVAAAENQLAAAQRSVKYAQDALNDARETAAERLADYSDKLRGAALDEEAAELAVRRARQTLQDTLGDPTSSKLDRDEAKQQLNEALFQLDQVRESRDELQDKAKEDLKAGVKGSDEVVAARRRLRDAQEALRGAEQALANARISAARSVEAAQQGVAAANQAAENAQGANARAAKALQDAQADQADALRTLATPAAQAFTAALDDAKDAWHLFLAGTEGPSLGIATQGLELFAKYLPDFVPVANAAAEAVEHLFDKFEAWADSGGMDSVTSFLEKYGPEMIESFGAILGNLAVWFGGIAEAFAPFAEEMMAGLEDLTAGWADWAQGLEDNPAFQNFIDYALENGPLFLDVLGSMWDALVNVGEALAPAAKPILLALRGVFDTIGDMDPTTLAIVVGIAGAIAALTVAPVAGTAIAVVALLAAFSDLAGQGGDLADTFGPLADGLELLWDDMQELADIIQGELRDAWQDLQPDIADLVDTVTDDLLPALHDTMPVMRALAHVVGPVVEFVFRGLIKTIRGLVKILSGTIEFLAGVFTGDWDRAWDGIKTIFSGAWDFITAYLGQALDLLWELTKSQLGWIKGKWDDMWGGIKDTTRDAAGWLADHIWRGDDSMLGRIKSGFRSAIDGIGDIWDGLREAAAAPVKFVVDTIYNDGIRKVVNAIPGIDDIDSVDTSGWSFAGGGVLPGHSPGRDIHRFTSPTAGVLNLGGGEGILTTRTTDKLGGAGGINALNRWGEQSFADGGRFWPLPGTHFQAMGTGMPGWSTYPGHDGIDLNTAGEDYGKPYYAAAAGTISYTGWDHGYGDAVFESGPYGTLVYGHSSGVAVRQGQSVAAGQLLGYVGSTGNSSGPHLHFGFPGGSPDGALAFLSGASDGAAGGSVSGGGDGNFLTKYAGAINAARKLVTDWPGWIDKLGDMGGWGKVLTGTASSLGRSAANFVNDKIPNRLLPDNPIDLGIFDNGGWLNPGSMAMNLGNTPERILTDEQWSALSGLALSGSGGLSKSDVDRIVAAIEDNRSVHVEAPDQATGREVVELLGYELRK